MLIVTFLLLTKIKPLPEGKQSSSIKRHTRAKGQNQPRMGIKVNFIFIWPIFFQRRDASALTAPYKSNEVVLNSHTCGRFSPLDRDVCQMLLWLIFLIFHILHLT